MAILAVLAKIGTAIVSGIKWVAKTFGPVLLDKCVSKAKDFIVGTKEEKQVLQEEVEKSPPFDARKASFDELVSKSNMIARFQNDASARAEEFSANFIGDFKDVLKDFSDNFKALNMGLDMDFDKNFARAKDVLKSHLISEVSLGNDEFADILRHSGSAGDFLDKTYEKGFKLFKNELESGLNSAFDNIHSKLDLNLNALQTQAQKSNEYLQDIAKFNDKGEKEKAQAKMSAEICKKMAIFEAL